MKNLISLLLLMLLLGCQARNHLHIKNDETIKSYSHKPHPNPIYTRSSFHEMARSINAHTPGPNSRFTRSGRVEFNSRRHSHAFHFEFDYVSDKRWSLQLYQDRDLKVSLQRNKVGMVYQSTEDKKFLETVESEVWLYLKNQGWKSQLIDFKTNLLPLRLDSHKAWFLEEEGIRHMIISTVSAERFRDVKHQYYLHRKKRVISRIIRNTVGDHIIEDLRFMDYKEWDGGYYMPKKIKLAYPRRHEDIRIRIHSTKISKATPNHSTFRYL